jgi:hypothetical protein
MSNVQLVIHKIERQELTDVRFPITDSVIKGNFRVIGVGAARVIAHQIEFLAQVALATGGVQNLALGRCVDDERKKILGGLSWPYELIAGQEVWGTFLISDVDIVGKLTKLGFATAEAVLAATNLTFTIRIALQIEGDETPPVAEAKIHVVAA